MIYPDNFERKIGFNEIRTLLKGRCISSLGTEWVDNRLSFKTTYPEVQKALAEVEDMMRFEQREDDDVELGFYDVRTALMRIRPERTYLEELELFDLKRSLSTVGELIRIITKEDEEASADVEGSPSSPAYPALAHFAEGIGSFPEIVRRIDAVLNRYGKMKDTASPELASIRHQLEQSARSISHTLRSIISSAQTEGYIDRDVSPTLRDGRLVIPVTPAAKRKIRGIVHDESATGKTVFIEPQAVVDANNRIRELRASERREIIRILQELSGLIRPHVSEILQTQTFLGHIDFLRATVAFASQLRCVIPRLKDAPVIDFVQAEHPLLRRSLEKHGRKIVPLDISLPADGKILLISGPNAGGKSVTLETVGLLQYMLQCGLPIPVSEHTTAGIFHDIFIDIGDEQSLEDDLSTYSGHLLNMKQMMRSASPTSLLLIDEFGGGTEPQIGAALAEGILKKFVDCGAYGIITTHYQNLKQFAKDHRAVVNGAMLYDRSKMQPLFVLQVGNPGSSFAIEIARKIGLPEDVIAYATDLVGKDYVMSDKYLLDIVRDKAYWEKKREKIHSREKQLEQTISQYEKEMGALGEERKAVIRQAKEEASELLKQTNARIENTIRSIRESQAEKEQTRRARSELDAFRDEVSTTAEDEARIARKMAQIARRQERRKEGKKAPKPAAKAAAANSPLNALVQAVAKAAAPLSPGDYVRIKGQGTVGRIDSISGKIAKVLFGVIYTKVAVDNLVHAQKPQAATSTQAATFITTETRDAVYQKKLNFKPEIDIRGMRGDEALSSIALFIDDAVLLEQANVRILHGTGTGALRELVRNYLATIPSVHRYHDEHVQFGGAGITVVEFA